MSKRYGTRRCARRCILLMTVVAGVAACDVSTKSADLVRSGKTLLDERNDPGAAAIQFKAAVQQEPGSGEARLLLGKALLQSGEAAGSVLEFNRALELKQPTEVVVPLLARALVESEQEKKLIQTYSGTTLTDKRSQAALQVELARAWTRLGDRAKAVKAIGEALAAVPNYPPALLQQATHAITEGKVAEAATLADAALAADPALPGGRTLRGRIHAGQGDMKAAEAALRKAIEQRKQDVDAHVWLVTLLASSGDLPAAKKAAEVMHEAVPTHPSTAYVDANLAYLEGNWARARELSQRLVEVAPDNDAVLILAGSVEARMGAVVQASAYFGKALSQSPALVPARLRLAETQIRLGQNAEALQTLRPLIGPDSNNPVALALAGDAELRRGGADRAERFLRQAAKLAPEDTQIQTVALQARIAMGGAATALPDLEALAGKTKETIADEALLAARMSRREYDAALATIDSLSRKQPARAADHAELRGRVYLARRDRAEARKAFEQALKADPARFSALRSLVVLDLVEKKPEQAAGRLQAALLANPRDSMALLTLAEIRERNGAPPAEIKKLLVDAVTATPSLVDARLRLIDYTLRRRQFKEAQGYANDAVAALPGSVPILEAAGRAQMLAGNFEQAATTYRKLATAVPNSAVPFVRLAESYVAVGKPEQAEAALNAGLEREPDNAAAQGALIDLLMSSNRGRDALQRAQRIRSARPSDPLGYILEAGVQERNRNDAAALAVLQDGVARTNTRTVAARLYLQLMRMKRIDEAIKFGDGWMRRNPGDSSFEYLLAEGELVRGEMRSAEQRLRRVVAANPLHVIALNNLAGVILRNGGNDALEFAQRAVDLRPDSATLMDTLAAAMAARGRVAEALDVQKHAVELAPDDNDVRLGLARIALQAGDKPLAREELTRLQKLGSAFAPQAEVGKLLQAL